MALEPADDRHEAQILAGTEGRTSGHGFEKRLAEDIVLLEPGEVCPAPTGSPHLVRGHPALELVQYVAGREGFAEVTGIRAWWLGGLATTRAGDVLLDAGSVVTKSKSDVLITLESLTRSIRRGVSVKTCNNATPTNAQLYFTTASAFANLLRMNDIVVSPEAEDALRMFCGDPGFRPSDGELAGERVSDPDRWFWEELPGDARQEWEKLFSERQDDVTRVLLQKAYPGDPFPPAYLMHQRFRCESPEDCPLALFSMDELVRHSRAAGGFSTRQYSIHKGRFRGDPNKHLAPRFGFVQMQRGGQAQHPTQLQFNLQAGYFNKVVSA